MPTDTSLPNSTGEPAAMALATAEEALRRSLLDRQTVQRMASYTEFTGLPLVCVNGATGEVCMRSDLELPVVLPPNVLRQLNAVSKPRVIEN
ncbi:MAG: hypothetical protein KDA79_18485, partial [Planctomycetaceae bacterium]|nr:hypothetical protein [Planctomycetaceae bacterium]